MKKMIIGMLVSMIVMSFVGIVGYVTIAKNYEAMERAENRCEIEYSN